MLYTKNFLLSSENKKSTHQKTTWPNVVNATNEQQNRIFGGCKAIL